MLLGLPRVEIPKFRSACGLPPLRVAPRCWSSLGAIFDTATLAPLLYEPHYRLDSISYIHTPAYSTPSTPPIDFCLRPPLFPFALSFAPTTRPPPRTRPRLVMIVLDILDILDALPDALSLSSVALLRTRLSATQKPRYIDTHRVTPNIRYALYFALYFQNSDMPYLSNNPPNARTALHCSALLWHGAGLVFRHTRTSLCCARPRARHTPRHALSTLPTPRHASS